MHTRIQAVINDFEDEMLTATTDDEKITVIAKNVQRIEQIHPFYDGNIRTCYILINKLLRDHGLSLTLLFNPNRLDACTVSNIVTMIKDGQALYQQLILNSDPTRFIIRANGDEIICKLYMDTPMEILQSFYKVLINSQPLAALPSVYQLGLTIFSQRSGSLYHTILREAITLKLRTKEPNLNVITDMIDWLKKANFTQAFRIACSNKFLSIIQLMLKMIKEVDLNASSYAQIWCMTK